jgi:hypothetical protein
MNKERRFSCILVSFMHSQAQIECFADVSQAHTLRARSEHFYVTS